MHRNKKIVRAHFSYVMTPAESFDLLTETKHPMAHYDLVFMIAMNLNLSIFPLKSCKEIKIEKNKKFT